MRGEINQEFPFKKDSARLIKARRLVDLICILRRSGEDEAAIMAAKT